MRINAYIANATGLSRRQAEGLIKSGAVSVNGVQAELWYQVSTDDLVELNHHKVFIKAPAIIMLNKPAGYVVSRNPQGANSIYDLLPKDLHNLKPVGRLDKESTGLLLLTNDGKLAQELTHPSFDKVKVYRIILDRPLKKEDEQTIAKGIRVENYLSKLEITDCSSDRRLLSVNLTQGKNRQIRKTFAKLGYQVLELHRLKFASFSLGSLKPGEFRHLSDGNIKKPVFK